MLDATKLDAPPRYYAQLPRQNTTLHIPVGVPGVPRGACPAMDALLRRNGDENAALCLSWSPQGATATGSCMIAACTEDLRCLAFCLPPGEMRNDYALACDLTVPIYTWLTDEDWRPAYAAAPTPPGTSPPNRLRGGGRAGGSGAAESSLSPGQAVEVCNDEPDLEHAWFEARLLRLTPSGSFGLVEYEALQESEADDAPNLKEWFPMWPGARLGADELRRSSKEDEDGEEVTFLERHKVQDRSTGFKMRPAMPATIARRGDVAGLRAGDPADVLSQDGWWNAMLLEGPEGRESVAVRIAGATGTNVFARVAVRDVRRAYQWNQRRAGKKQYELAGDWDELPPFERWWAKYYLGWWKQTGRDEEERLRAEGEDAMPEPPEEPKRPRSPAKKARSPAKAPTPRKVPRRSASDAAAPAKPRRSALVAQPRAPAPAGSEEEPATTERDTPSDDGRSPDAFASTGPSRSTSSQATSESESELGAEASRKRHADAGAGDEPAAKARKTKHGKSARRGLGDDAPPRNWTDPFGAGPPKPDDAFDPGGVPDLREDVDAGEAARLCVLARLGALIVEAGDRGELIWTDAAPAEMTPNPVLSGRITAPSHPLLRRAFQELAWKHGAALDAKLRAGGTSGGGASIRELWNKVCKDLESEATNKFGLGEQHPLVVAHYCKYPYKSGGRLAYQYSVPPGFSREDLPAVENIDEAEGAALTALLTDVAIRRVAALRQAVEPQDLTPYIAGRGSGRFMKIYGMDLMMQVRVQAELEAAFDAAVWERANTTALEAGASEESAGDEEDAQAAVAEFETRSFAFTARAVAWSPTLMLPSADAGEGGSVLGTLVAVGMQSGHVVLVRQRADAAPDRMGSSEPAQLVKLEAGCFDVEGGVRAHGAAITCLCWAEGIMSGAPTLLSGAADGSVRVWAVAEGGGTGWHAARDGGGTAGLRLAAEIQPPIGRAITCMCARWTDLTLLDRGSDDADSPEDSDEDKYALVVAVGLATGGMTAWIRPWWSPASLVHGVNDPAQWQRERHEDDCHALPLTFVGYAAGCDSYVTASQDGSIKLWEFESETLRFVSRPPKPLYGAAAASLPVAPVLSAALSPCGLVVAGLCDLEDGRPPASGSIGPPHDGQVRLFRTYGAGTNAPQLAAAAMIGDAIDATLRNREERDAVAGKGIVRCRKGSFPAQLLYEAALLIYLDVIEWGGGSSATEASCASQIVRSLASAAELLGGTAAEGILGARSRAKLTSSVSDLALQMRSSRAWGAAKVALSLERAVAAIAARIAPPPGAPVSDEALSNRAIEAAKGGTVLPREVVDKIEVLLTQRAALAAVEGAGSALDLVSSAWAWVWACKEASCTWLSPRLVGAVQDCVEDSSLLDGLQEEISLESAEPAAAAAAARARATEQGGGKRAVPRCGATFGEMSPVEVPEWTCTLCGRMYARMCFAGEEHWSRECMYCAVALVHRLRGHTRPGPCLPVPPA
ncbi:unnamed protein product [Pedinophyceae sp. YPF-701]|nr:unnamed protein product [Pedinophyceae sp. YPF-701]